jgi:hypothetical protein
MILIEARRQAIEMSITDFAGTILWCKKIYEKKWSVYAMILVAVTMVF